jgi:hypothetical protein
MTAERRPGSRGLEHYAPELIARLERLKAETDIDKVRQEIEELRRRIAELRLARPPLTPLPPRLALPLPPAVPQPLPVPGAPPVEAPAPVPALRPLRYAGTLGDTEIEVRGPSSIIVTVDDKRGEILIAMPDGTIRIRSNAGPESAPGN